MADKVKQNIEQTKKAIEAFIAAICEKPETFKVNVLEGSKDVVFEVIGTDPVETGKIIGRRGSKGRALRTLVQAAGRKVNKKFLLEIVDKT